MKHRPTLYIGIGGMGCKTLIEIQNNFTDEFGKGNIPEQIRFIGVDTDYSPEMEKQEKFFHIMYGSMSPKDYYVEQKERETGRCDWYTNDPNLLPGQRCGTASNRSNARFIFEMNSYDLMSYIRRTLADLSSIALYESGISEVDVRFVMSLAGGTGSGILIPLAVLISQYDKVNIYGYSLLHGILRKYDMADRVITNASMNCYATTLELDYIQHATVERPFKIKINDIDFTIVDQLFEEFYMVESTDGFGRIVDSYADLLRMLSLSMYSASFDGYHSDIKDCIKAGIFNVANKKGWLCSLGGCEITYQSDVAAQLQAYAESRKIIAKLLGSAEEEADVVRTMVLSGIFGIEDPHYWQHLKSIFHLAKDRDDKDFRITSNRLEIIKDQIEIARKPVILSCVPGCIELNVGDSSDLSTLEKTLVSLEQELPHILVKLEEQKSSIRKSLEMVLGHIEDEYLYLTRFRGFFMAFQHEKKEVVIIDLESMVKKAITLQQEIALREYVADRVGMMRAEIGTYMSKCQLLRTQLQEVDTLMEKGIDDQLLKLRKDRTIFKHDISYAYWKSKQEETEEVIVPSRILTELLDCDDVKADDLVGKLLDTVRLSPAVQHYRDIIIEDIIESLPEMYRDGVCRFLNTSANRMLALDGRGHPEIFPVNKGILTVYSNKQIPSIAKDLTQIFNMAVHVHLNHSTASGLKDRLILSCYEGAVLPYFIRAFEPEMITRYSPRNIESGGYNPYIDAGLFEILKASDYTLQPDSVMAEIPMPEPEPMPAPEPVPAPELKPVPEPAPDQAPKPTEVKTKKYNVFISSKSEDYKYAEQVYDFLVEHNLSVFLACRELKRIGEAEYANAIDAALDDTEHMVVMLSSPDYAKSKWVRYEWSTFENDKKSGYRDGNLLVIKLPEVEQKMLPPALRHKETFFFDSYQESLLSYLK